MQKVAWPRTMVQKLKSTFIMLKAERSEMPVMMPGSAIGRMKRSEMVSRPKNFARARAAAAQVPRMRAMAVAKVATLSESEMALHMSVLSQAIENQRSV